MKLRNHTDIPSPLIRAIIAAVRPAGISRFDVRVSNYAGKGARGRSYSSGSAYHATADPFIVVSIARTDAKARFINKAEDGYLSVKIGSRIEALVFILAHELRHLWQAGGTLDNHNRVVKPRRGMVYGARGRFSERDADAYALRILRRFRRGEFSAVTAAM